MMTLMFCCLNNKKFFVDYSFNHNIHLFLQS